MVHGNHGGEISLEHVLPLLFPNVLAMVCSSRRLGRPFLLEIRSTDDVWSLKL